MEGFIGGGVSEDENADECEEATLPDSSQFFKVIEPLLPLVDGVGDVGEDPINTCEVRSDIL